MFLVFLRKSLAIKTQANLCTNHVQRGHRGRAGVQKLALLSHQRDSKPLEKLASKCIISHWQKVELGDTPNARYRTCKLSAEELNGWQLSVSNEQRIAIFKMLTKLVISNWSIQQNALQQLRKNHIWCPNWCSAALVTGSSIKLPTRRGQLEITHKWSVCFDIAVHISHNFRFALFNMLMLVKSEWKFLPEKKLTY